MANSSFEERFETLTGKKPFPWQEALYERFLRNDIPASCNLPTGLGKTLVLAIWLLARERCPNALPRRLVYVVNRRTVVDQTTTEAEKLRRNAVAAGVTQPAISTLRGQFADNREWSADPSQPAIIVGTVDMIGSRLLFSGYGVGFKARPLHAGFLGQDALLVHDEAHLEPAFQQLIERIQQEQQRIDFRPLRVLELTATSRGREVFPDKVERAVNETHPVVRQRVGAKKALWFHPISDEKKQLADEIARFALEHRKSGRAIVVFVRTVEDVEKIVGKLQKEKQKVQQLTGTLRGLERDRLVEDAIFQRFLPTEGQGEETVYLVCTSAGEVGVNLSADHLVCDLTTFESMAQRFGRVNRFGTREDTRIDIVHSTEFDDKETYEQRRRRTLELLRRLEGDGSPAALGRLDQQACSAAFAPAPTILPVTDFHFDTWAMTSIREKLPGRPRIEPYLHGLSGWQPPETHVAWREEVGHITGALARHHRPVDLLEVYPLKPHELLRDRSDRVFKHLAKVAERWPKLPAWLLDEDGTVTQTTLADLTDKDSREQLHYRTVLLPPSVGGLQKGMLRGEEPAGENMDVADHWLEDSVPPRQRRLRVWSDEPDPEPSEIEATRGMRLVLQIDTGAGEEDRAEPTSIQDNNSSPPGRYWRWYTRPRSAEDDMSLTARQAVLLEVHTEDVVEQVKGIVERLNLPMDLKEACLLAARWHDEGKKRALFQAVLGNTDPGRHLAKSDGRTYEVSNYRHEFGSLVEMGKIGDVMDLVLHLVAAHHGHARPHFPPGRAFDPEARAEVAMQITREVPQRFGRLQRQFGRWGLAYLESLLRAADHAASANPSRCLGGES